MKKLLLVISVVTVTVLLMCAPSSQAAAAPTVTIKVRKLPPSGLLELAVGESHTFEVYIKSDEPFILAMALTNEYYPGRGIFWHDSDRVSHDTSAVLYLTMTGKETTSYLPAVCDWPEPGDCWPEGVAPVAIAAGVRFAGGQTVAQQFAFAVEVP